MSKTKWIGQDELLECLTVLCQGEKRPFSESRINQAADIAIKFQPEYKMVVYEIEKFIKKASNEVKLAGVLVIDKLCFAKNNAVYAARFGLRIKDTLASLNQLSAEDQGLLRFILSNWIKLETFSPQTLSEISEACSRVAVSEVIEHSAQPSVSRPIDPRLRKGSQTAIEPKPQQPSEYSEKDAKPLVIAKLCPFKTSDSSSCPYGANCRYSHADWVATQSVFAALSYPKSNPQAEEPFYLPKYYIKSSMSSGDKFLYELLSLDHLQDASSQSKITAILGDAVGSTRSISAEEFESALKRKKL